MNHCCTHNYFRITPQQIGGNKMYSFVYFNKGQQNITTSQILTLLVQTPDVLKPRISCMFMNYMINSSNKTRQISKVNSQLTHRLQFDSIIIQSNKLEF